MKYKFNELFEISRSMAKVVIEFALVIVVVIIYFTS